MTATHSECPGLRKHPPSFSKFYLFGGPKLDGSTRPGAQHTWRHSQFPFGADVNRLCRSHQRHHGAPLRAQLARHCDPFSVSSVLHVRWERSQEVKERNNIQLISKGKPVLNVECGFYTLVRVQTREMNTQRGSGVSRHTNTHRKRYWHSFMDE